MAAELLERWSQQATPYANTCPPHMPHLPTTNAPPICLRPQIILKLAAGNGVQKVVVGKDAIMATPAMSALIRRRGLYGGLIMSASHNPGGPGAAGQRGGGVVVERRLG